MDWAEETTAGNERITLFVAFNYGGRAEIVDAARSFEGDSEEEFRRSLYAPEMHDPDLLIRTSGEQRISNYLLWQCAYSELVFRDELWPDFSARGIRGVAARVRGAPAPLRGEGLAWTGRAEPRFDGRAGHRFAEEPTARGLEAAVEEDATGAGRHEQPRALARSSGGETARRMLVAIPWIVFAIAIIGRRRLGLRARDDRRSASLCLREYFVMTERAASDPDRRLSARCRR